MRIAFATCGAKPDGYEDDQPVAAAAGALYARWDLIPGVDESPVLLELEMIEPALYLTCAAGAADRLAAAIRAC